MTDNQSDTATTSETPLLISAKPLDSINVGDSKLLCAASIPNTNEIVYGTNAPELIYPPHTKVTLESNPQAIACARYVALDERSLPEQTSVIIVLLEGNGLKIYDYPSLKQLQQHEQLSNDLMTISNKAHTCSVDSLGSDLVSESFRIALATNDTVILLDVNIPRTKITILGQYTLDDRLVTVTFSEMTIVASTQRLHYMLRISRGGGIAVAATVPRFDRLRRSSSSETGTGGAAVMSFLGGLFTRRNINANTSPVFAHALPDNRWLLTVDGELITYSSFGAKLEEMENVFKSKVGLDASDIGTIIKTGGASTIGVGGTGSVTGSASKGGINRNKNQSILGDAKSIRGSVAGSMRPGIVKSGSSSSLGSVATGVSYMTLIDQSSAMRAEKPPTVTAFSSPFVLSVTSDNELMAFAANGSIPGVINSLSLLSKEEKEEQKKKQPQQQQYAGAGVKMITCRHERTLAIVFWPNGKVISIELKDDLEALAEKSEQENQLRLALALVPADQIDRMINLRRLLAFEARATDWHDAAIHHMQVVVNLSMRMDGVDQVDLVSEAIELRGKSNNTTTASTNNYVSDNSNIDNAISAPLPSNSNPALPTAATSSSSWHSDLVIATLWADFVFRLRRRVMRPSPADIDILQTLCYADESSARVKSLLSVKHDISLSAGEAMITSPECVMREEEKVEALVALYTSLAEHGKALVLLENTELTNSFDGVVGYLSNSMKPGDNVDVYFSHLKWVAHRAKNEAQGRTKLEKLSRAILADSDELGLIMGRLIDVLVEEMDDLAIAILKEVAPSSGTSDEADSNARKAKDERRAMNEKTVKLEVSADVTAAGMLSGMSKANALSRQEVFETLRTLFNERILHNNDASYHAFTLLQVLQTAKYKALRLHEEQAYLLGQQGRHEAAADELAAEKNLQADEALTRLTRMLPAAEKASAAENLVAAYLRVSAQGRAMRVAEAAKIIKCCAGTIEVEKAVLDGRCADDALTLADMWPLIKEAIVAANDRFRIAECIRAMRKSEIGRMREEVLMRRKRFVVIGHDRACVLCTRRIGDSAFVAYPDGSVAHLYCHKSRDSR